MSRQALHLERARAALQVDPAQAQHWIDYIEALLQTGRVGEARRILTLGQQKGLQAQAVEHLVQRLASASTDRMQASDSARAHNQQGMRHRAQGQLHAAEASFRQALAIEPGLGVAHYNLGNTLNTLCRPVEAEASLRRAIELEPGTAEAHFQLGASLQAQGRAEEAMACYGEVIRLNPSIAEAHYNLGTLLQTQDRWDAAAASYQRAVLMRPDFAAAHCNLGVTLHALGRLRESVESLRRSIELDPHNVQAHANLGASLQALEQPGLAEISLRHALAMDPDDATVHNNLGIALGDLKRFSEAEVSFRRALWLRPDFVDAHYNLSDPLRNLGRMQEAAASLGCALALKPDFAEAHYSLGDTYRSLGRLDEAEASYRQALVHAPDLAHAFHALLFTLNYHPDKSAEEIFRAYKSYEIRFGSPWYSKWTEFRNDRSTSRRLRIGYVSPDFRQHSVRHFLEPLVSHHDHARFELFAYAELAAEDAVTARYRSCFDHWRPTRGVSDEDLAARIRADKIDILIDVAGHTEGGRLQVFARKPAPVSMTWLGYGYTTGLSAIDYLLTDETSAPVGSEPLFAETPWRLSGSCYVFRPDPGMGDVSALPALSRGYVTFGTLSRAIRINHRCIRVWADLLQRVPCSRLVIDSKNFQHASMQEAMTAHFADQGIAPERLQIGCHSPPWDTLRGMDIGLDCFPHNSGTTLFETLFMGVPYVTLAGRPSVGRMGASILDGLNRAQWTRQWVAQSEEDYVAKAAALASDLQTLAQIRSTLRPAMQASALMDEAGFARRVENSYQRMFERWASQQETGR